MEMAAATSSSYFLVVVFLGLGNVQNGAERSVFWVSEAEPNCCKPLHGMCVCVVYGIKKKSDLGTHQVYTPHKHVYELTYGS